MYSSPVQLSQFDPQGLKICYVTVELDRQRVTVVDTNGQNEQSMLLDKSSLQVDCVEWAQIGDVSCVLLGLNEGEVWVYAPAANRIMGKMITGDSFQIKDLAITGDSHCWAVDSQDTFYKFEMVDFSLREKFKVENCEQINKLCLLDSENLLVASHSVSMVHLPSKSVTRTFPGHVTPITHLRLVSQGFFITGALNDRFLNVYDIETTITKSVLVLQSNLSQVSLQDDSCVVATTEEGEVEVFEDPLVPVKGNKRRANRSKQCNKRIYTNSASNGGTAFYNAHLAGEIVQLSWFENVTVPRFASLQWRQLPADYEFEIKSLQKSLKSATSNGLHTAEPAAPTSYKEGNASVTSGDNFRHVSDAIRDWENEMAELERLNVQPHAESLADRLGQRAITQGKRKAWTTPGTVTVLLSQALQSNDHSLLETALNNKDERMIRDTVSRLRPPLAVLLLERLADRIARQSHRQQQLNIWVKWTLVIHGGYLVSIPNLMSSLSSLHSTLKRRSNLLPRLLVLETRIESTLNTLHQEDENLEPLGDSDEDEQDVEYNEEREDALMEDGEADEDESEDEEEDEEEYEQDEEELPDGISQESIQVE
ncbi:hypothetical protein ZYGR_0N04930 [Zygosaccharomyces rouxii]|uniref:ZYRO0D11616p n=2 Tax=Zygosaccharomyces rouxii TaxID=4956 RepID=C5DW36_ZYGRC|nr:uncharacterized protein ZYRO0D11616g [Zygosaccharomyces rouxii]KAH9200915.1 Dip2/Utp12 family-domain-containing protein [Zygosaccharomyces rouxii]GAV49088.1 hypothetical protein ZYGR_0N04930 [Zygosaccharomyces rouxii]CAR28005.1 ZYRO0D11616p [Zygosaccharomyces rouxii]